MSAFLTTHLLEIIASLTGLINLWLVTRGSQWNWLFGMITVSLYFFIFLKVNLYANMALQLVFLSLQFYGLLHWHQKRTQGHILLVQTLSHRQRLITSMLTVLCYVLTGVILQQYTQEPSLVWIDALVTALSLAAQWLMARRYLEHWWVWMMVDMIAAGLYLQKSLYFSSALYMIYFFFCVQGLMLWKKYISHESIVKKP